MAETFTPRLGLIQWGAATDGPTRTEFNTAFSNLETLTGIDKQGTLAARPAAGVRGTYYWDTTNNVLYRDTGSAWFSVGGSGYDAVFTASSINNRPITLNAPVGQLANLLTANVNASPIAEITNTGAFISASTYTGKSLSMVNGTAGNVVIDGQGAASQSADILRLRNSAATNLLRLTAAGVLIGQSFQIENGRAVFGGTSSSSVTGSFFSGQAAVEMVGITGGASSTYKDFVLIQHQAADATAVQRALGLHMMVGITDEAKSGSVYITSSAANFDSPSLVLARGGSSVLTFPASGNASFGSGFGVTIPQNNDATLGQANPSLMIGAANAANLIASGNKLVARNNGAAAGLSINPDGGTVTIGGDISVVASKNATFKEASVDVQDASSTKVVELGLQASGAYGLAELDALGVLSPLARFAIGANLKGNTVDAGEKTTDTGSFVDLTTVGPTVTDVQVSSIGMMVIGLSAHIGIGGSSSGYGTGGNMGYELYNQDTSTVIQVAAYSRSVRHHSIGYTSSQASIPACMRFFVVTGLSAGLYRVRAKYQSNGNNGGNGPEFANRTVVAFGF